jgi:hypothetical protein
MAFSAMGAALVGYKDSIGHLCRKLLLAIFENLMLTTESSSLEFPHGDLTRW